MIDVSKAFEILDNGLALVDKSGETQAYFTTGTGDPSGNPAPINTFYFRKDTQGIYLKFGALNSEWRLLSAQDLRALDTSLLVTDPLYDTTIQEILNKLLAGDTPAVSQTMIFGDGGNTTSNSYLPNQGVPSNLVGVPVGLNNAALRSFFLNNQNIQTGPVYVRADGAIVYTANLVAQSKLIVTGLNVPITTNAEISVQTGVALKNAKVVLNINGDSA